VVALLALALARPAAAATLHGVDLPRGSRAVPEVDNLFTSGRTFRQTVQFYQRLFDRRGTPHQALPPYRYRGVVLARFLSGDPRSPWLAVHVFQRRGVTQIYVVPRSPLTSDLPRGKEPGL
jgi:hypothetical protein